MAALQRRRSTLPPASSELRNPFVLPYLRMAWPNVPIHDGAGYKYVDMDKRVYDPQGAMTISQTTGQRNGGGYGPPSTTFRGDVAGQDFAADTAGCKLVYRGIDDDITTVMFGEMDPTAVESEIYLFQRWESNLVLSDNPDNRISWEATNIPSGDLAGPLPWKLRARPGTYASDSSLSGANLHGYLFDANQSDVYVCAPMTLFTGNPFDGNNSYYVSRGSLFFDENYTRQSEANFKQKTGSSIYNDGQLNDGGHGMTLATAYGAALKPPSPLTGDGILFPGLYPVVNGIQTGPRTVLCVNFCNTTYHQADISGMPYGTSENKFEIQNRDANSMWPAEKTGGEIGLYTSEHPEELAGHRKAIPRDSVLASEKTAGRVLHGSLAEIQANLETTPAKMLAWTAQKYGFIGLEELGTTYWARMQFTVCNMTGQPGDNVDHYDFMSLWNDAWRAEGGVHADISFKTGTGANDPWTRDCELIASHLYAVTGTSASAPGGPGDPLAPYAQPFDANLVPASIRDALIARGEADYRTSR